MFRDFLYSILESGQCSQMFYNVNQAEILESIWKWNWKYKLWLEWQIVYLGYRLWGGFSLLVHLHTAPQTCVSVLLCHLRHLATFNLFRLCNCPICIVCRSTRQYDLSRLPYFFEFSTPVRSVYVHELTVRGPPSNNRCPVAPDPPVYCDWQNQSRHAP